VTQSLQAASDEFFDVLKKTDKTKSDTIARARLIKDELRKSSQRKTSQRYNKNLEYTRLLREKSNLFEFLP